MSIKNTLDNLTKWLRYGPHTEIEAFIARNNPKNAADVEHLIKQWNYSQERCWL